MQPQSIRRAWSRVTEQGTGMRDQLQKERLLSRGSHDLNTSQAVANLQLCQEV